MQWHSPANTWSLCVCVWTQSERERKSNETTGLLISAMNVRQFKRIPPTSTATLWAVNQTPKANTSQKSVSVSFSKAMHDCLCKCSLRLYMYISAVYIYLASGRFFFPSCLINFKILAFFFPFNSYSSPSPPPGVHFATPKSTMQLLVVRLCFPISFLLIQHPFSLFFCP